MTQNLKWSRKGVAIRLVIVRWQTAMSIVASTATMPAIPWNYPATVGILAVQTNSHTGPRPMLQQCHSSPSSHDAATCSVPWTEVESRP